MINNITALPNYNTPKKATPVQFKASNTPKNNDNLVLDKDKIKKDYINLETIRGMGIGACMGAIVGLVSLLSKKIDYAGLKIGLVFASPIASALFARVIAKSTWESSVAPQIEELEKIQKQKR